MRMLLRLVAAAALAALSAGAAHAVATLAAPAPGSSMTATHPAFAWTLPAGETVESISVARSPKISPSTNDFTLADLQDSAVLAPGVSKWSPTRAMPAGKYYWHVASKTETVKHMFSPTSSFTIRPAITKPVIAVKTYPGQRSFIVTTSWTANERKVDLVAKLFAGSKLLGVHKVATDNVLIDARKVDLSTWMLPPTVKTGARLRFVASLKSAGGAKSSGAKTFRAP